MLFNIQKTRYSSNKNNNYFLSLNKVSTCLFNSFKPYIIYNNSWLNKYNIYKENRGKSGIYRWVNKLNNESYIGSSINLTNRLRAYYSKKYLNNKAGNSNINRALLQYGYDNFNLEILEYCNKKNVISREQYYFKFLNPEYNILKKAGSSSGFKHSFCSKLKMSNKKRRKKKIICLKSIQKKRGLIYIL